MNQHEGEVPPSISTCIAGTWNGCRNFLLQNILKHWFSSGYFLSPMNLKILLWKKLRSISSCTEERNKWCLKKFNLDLGFFKFFSFFSGIPWSEVTDSVAGQKQLSCLCCGLFYITLFFFVTEEWQFGRTRAQQFFTRRQPLPWVTPS